MRAAAKMMMARNATSRNESNTESNEMRRGGNRNEMNYRNEGNEMRGGYRNEMNDDTEMRRRRDSRGRFMEGDMDMRGEMENRNESENRRGGYRNEMENEMRRGGYRNEGNEDAEMRRGRYRNEGEEGAEMRYESPESRFRDRRGREHYDNGRFAPMRGMMEDEPQNYPYFPPYMPRQEERMIGFGYDTMKQGGMSEGGQMQKGMSEGKPMDLDQMSAEQWARSMEKEDGSKGPKWTKEQVKPYMAQVGYNGPEHKFWAVMNAMYSDYCKIAKKYGHDRPEYYADLAKAWLEDKDANPEKAGLYYKYIVKH